MTFADRTVSVDASPSPHGRGRQPLRSLAAPAGTLLCVLLAGLCLTAAVPGQAGQAAAPGREEGLLAAGPISAQQPVSPTAFLPLIVGPVAEPGPVNVWQAAYYAGEDLSGDPVHTAEETRIDYDWGEDGHPPGVSADHFSARWEGNWEMEEGIYTFFIFADDGVRLWLDESLVVDYWSPGMGSHVATVEIKTAGPHHLRLEYFEVTGSAAIRLHWRRTDLYPRWEGDYYRLPWVEDGHMYERLDDAIQFDWGMEAPEGLPDDGFSVSWSARRVFEPGTHRLYVYADEGYRLYVDGNLLGQGGWEDGEAGGAVDTVFTFEAPTLAYHDVRYDFHDRGTLAEARLWLEYAERPPWTAQYYPNRSLTGEPTVVRQEDAVFYDWGLERARPKLPSADNFSVRWSGERYFHSGCYRFGLFVDDGVRLWIDGELLLDEWHDGRGEYHTPVKYLAGGLHEVVIEYYEATGEAEMRFWWE